MLFPLLPNHTDDWAKSQEDVDGTNVHLTLSVYLFRMHYNLPNFNVLKIESYWVVVEDVIFKFNGTNLQ